MKVFGQSRDLTKMSEIGAATQRDMLAVVNFCVCGWIVERAGAAAQSCPRFQQRATESSFGQRHAGGQSRQATSRNRNPRRHRHSGNINLLEQLALKQQFEVI